MENLDRFITDLLHLEDARSNKLVDVGNLFGDGKASETDGERAYKLTNKSGRDSESMLSSICANKGKSGNTVLTGSALVKATTSVRGDRWEWKNLNGSSDPAKLDKFIEDAYKELNLKGNNPLFLGVGCLRWETAVSQEVVKVASPLLIFPIRLVRGSSTMDVQVEFVDDDAYFNPCLLNKMRMTLPAAVADAFPHPNGKGADYDEPIDLKKLGDGRDYFERVAQFVERCVSDGGVFELHKDAIVIAQYNHSDMCMYYDVRRNKEKIYEHPLVRAVFGGEKLPRGSANSPMAALILPADSIQEDLIARVVAGESLIVKGPPGTGKTLTIANMIAALLASGKKVLMASKKLSALAEVNAKLPEKLRKFVMLLDYETEKQAAAVNPEEIKKDLKSILVSRQQYMPDSTILATSGSAKALREEAIGTLLPYVNKMFGERDVAGISYYEALDTYFKNDTPVLRFAAPKDAAGLTQLEYKMLEDKVIEAEKHFERMSSLGAASKSPWYGVSPTVNAEAALAEYEQIVPLINEALDALSEFFARFEQANLTEMPIADIADAIGGDILSRVQIAKLLALEEPKYNAKQLGEMVSALISGGDGFDFGEGTDSCFAALEKCKTDRDMTLSDMKKIYDHAELLNKIDAARMKKLLEAVDRIDKAQAKQSELQMRVLAVFDSLNEEREKTLLGAYEPLSKFLGVDGEPKMFDFKAKGAFKKAAALSYIADVKFSAVVDAVCALKELKDSERTVNAQYTFISAALGEQTNSDAVDAIALVLRKCGGDENKLKAMVSSISAEYKTVRTCVDKCVAAPKDFALGKLIEAYISHKKKSMLESAVKAIDKQAGLELERFDGDVATAMVRVMVFDKMKAFEQLSDAEKTDILCEAARIDPSVRGKIIAVFDKFEQFGNNFFQNYYTRSLSTLSATELKAFTVGATDRAALASGMAFGAIVEDENSPLPLGEFFGLYESEGCAAKHLDVSDTFEHSFYALAIEHKRSVINAHVGSDVLSALDKFESAEDKQRECNLKYIENLCMSRINPKDVDFEFLDADKGARTTLRGLFKTRASGLLKLKSCFILSPSTASVLFRPEEFSDFDVAIIDEASQLEPVNLLPILMRSKQCVLVGDEFQMPPITHFKAKNPGRVEDETQDLVIDSDISALSLALTNNAFAAIGLACHYRSNTEALIAFSQREFYPYMRTFPAAVPFGEGLGFTDIYVEDGRCDSGVNPTEVQKVVECLEQHFAKYYDENASVLKKSVGVVAFGEKQLQKIISAVNKNKPLLTKIEKAKAKFDDVPEKLIFFRTIESVQGQESDSLILSLTYGRDKDGKVKQSFGELNRDALGKCIFNVAVTRSKSHVTIIHSVKAEEIDAESRVSFIRNYLLLVERYCSGGRDQFTSAEPENGAHFIKSVANFIISQGIEPERVVINYGVTDGSVRVPIAILSKDMTHAQLGIWCEAPLGKKYDFFDYHLRYYRILESRGWKLARVYINDWMTNGEHEKRALASAIGKFVK